MCVQGLTVFTAHFVIVIYSIVMLHIFMSSQKVLCTVNVLKLINGGRLGKVIYLKEEELCPMSLTKALQPTFGEALSSLPRRLWFCSNGLFVC